MDISRSFQNPTPQLKFKALLQKFLNCRHTATVFDFLGHRHWYHKVWKSFLPNFHISILFALCHLMELTCKETSSSRSCFQILRAFPANVLVCWECTLLPMPWISPGQRCWRAKLEQHMGNHPAWPWDFQIHTTALMKRTGPTISVDFANAHKSCECLCPIGFSVPQKVVKKKLLLHWHCHHPETARLAKVVPQLRSAGVETPLHWNTKNMHPAQRHWLVQYGF